MKKIITVLLFCFLPLLVNAKDITKSSTITVDNEKYTKMLDGDENRYSIIHKGSTINIKSDKEIYGLYIIYELKSVKGTISNLNKSANIAAKGFLHEYIDVNDLIGASKEINIQFDDEVKIGELYILDNGEMPDFVEIWQEPVKEADLLLFSTHSDDEQLFFAGLLPYYVAKGASVEVVYFTNHNDNPKRLHEQLHGLYTVGIRNYPIIGFIPDAYSESLDDALNKLNESGYSEDDAIKFIVQMIRRFKPLVVVGHDEKGEYSHGQHILCTHVLEKAIELTNLKTYDEASYKEYGLWDTPKTYMHLYNKNKIKMNYDEPLDYFNGMTAYEVSKLGYSKHLSQQFTWFTKWLTGVDSDGKGTEYKKATEIKTYSPLEFGLYKSLVGDDKNKNDMFENLTMRKDQVSVNTDKDVMFENSEKPTIETNNNKTTFIVGLGLTISSTLALIIIRNYIKHNKQKDMS